MKQRTPLPVGTKLYQKNEECYIIKKVCGFGGNSLIYEVEKNGSKRSFALKECFPNADVDNEYCFIRDDMWNIIPLSSQEGLLKSASLFYEKTKRNMERECCIGQEIASKMGKIIAAWEKTEIVSAVINGKTISIDNSCFIVMEQLEGKGYFFKDILKECQKTGYLHHPLYTGGQPSLQIVINIIKEVCKTLSTLHKVGYIHGDINFGNLFFMSPFLERGDVGDVFLLDFGCARKLSHKSSKAKFLYTEEIGTNDIWTTKEFGCPEIRTSNDGHLKLCETADIFSVGCLFLYLLKENPFAEWDSLQNINKIHYVSSREIIKIGGNIEAAEKINSLLSWALKMQPEERCTALQMLDALESIEQSLKKIETDGWKKYTKNRNLHPITLKYSGGTYVNRKKLLNNLDELLHRNQFKKQKAFISGFAGEGKSELARAFAYTHRGEYHDIFWISVPEEYNAQNKMPPLEELLSNSGYTISAEELSLLESDNLFIIDNYNQDNAIFVRDIEMKTGKAMLLFTTRLIRHSDVDYDMFLRMDSDETEKLETSYSIFKNNYELEDKYGRRKKITDDEKEVVKKICHLVAYNMMFITLIAIELRDYRKYTIDMYEKKLRKGIYNVRAEGIKLDIVKDYVSIHEELLVIMGVLMKDLLTYEFNHYEKQILTVMSWIPAISLPNYFLYSLLGDNEDLSYIESACDEMARRNWLQDDGERTAMHPLVSAMLSSKQMLIESESEVKSFTEHLIDNWLCLDDEMKSIEQYFMDLILNKAGNIDTDKAAAMLLEFHPSKFEKIYSELYNGADIGIYVQIYNNVGVQYVLYNGKKKSEKVVIDLENHKVNAPYWKSEVISLLSASCLKARIMRIIIKKKFVFNLQIPNQIKGIDVTEFSNMVLGGYKAQEDFKCIYKMVMPLKVKRIEQFTFFNKNQYSGSFIWKIVFPGELEYIGKYSFAHFGAFGKVSFPEKCVEIDEHAFEGCAFLNLILPNKLKRITKYAFSNCEFWKILFPEKLKIIDDHAFEKASFERKKTIRTYPLELERIGDYAFYECYGKGQFQFSSNLQEIGNYSFYNCFLDGNCQFPETLKKIGAFAFAECQGLRKVYFPDGLDKIGDYAFKNCWSLIPENKPENLEVYGKNAFEGCDLMCLTDIQKENNDSSLKEGTKSKDKEHDWVKKLSLYLELKKGNINEISDHMFERNYNFSSTPIRLKNGITCIGKSAFKGSNIERIYLPDSLRQIEQSAFESARNLNKIKFNTGLTDIGEKAFMGCSHLSGVLEFTQTVLSIGSFAFKDCYSLEGVDFPKSLRHIGEAAFEDCRKLSGYLKFPDKIMQIEKATFKNCHRLKGIINLPKQITYIGESAFEGCHGLEGELSLPESLIHIGKYAFKECANIKGELCLPKQIIYIGESAFKECHGLEGTLRLPECLSEIEESTFEDCMGLSGIIFPTKLIKIGKAAFKHCWNLENELVFPINLEEIGEAAFENTRLAGTIVLHEKIRKIDNSVFAETLLQKAVILNDDIEIIGRPFEANVIICCRHNSNAECWARNSIPRYEVEYINE